MLNHVEALPASLSQASSVGKVMRRVREQVQEPWLWSAWGVVNILEQSFGEKNIHLLLLYQLYL